MKTGVETIRTAVLSAGLLVALAAAAAGATVVTQPLPAGETPSVDYRVEAGGQSVAVYTARTLDAPFAGKEWDFGGPYSFANFDTDGPVTEGNDIRILGRGILDGSDYEWRKMPYGHTIGIHGTMTPFLFEPGEDMRLEDVTVRDVRLHGEGQNEFIRLRPVVNQYMHRQVPGFVRNIRFENVTVEGAPGAYRVQVMGADPEHNVSDVAFEGVRLPDGPLVRESSRVQINPHTTNISFRASTAAARDKEKKP